MVSSQKATIGKVITGNKKQRNIIENLNMNANNLVGSASEQVNYTNVPSRRSQSKNDKYKETEF